MTIINGFMIIQQKNNPPLLEGNKKRNIKKRAETRASWVSETAHPSKGRPGPWRGDGWEGKDPPASSDSGSGGCGWIRCHSRSFPGIPGRPGAGRPRWFPAPGRNDPSYRKRWLPFPGGRLCHSRRGCRPGRKRLL